MPSLSSGYRNGWSENAKRHERIRRAELELRAERLKQKARDIVFEARDAEWQRLNRLADHAAECGDYAGAEDHLLAMSDRFEANVRDGLDGVPAAEREEVGVAVTEFLGRLTGVM